MTKPNEQRGRTVIRVAFNVLDESIRSRLSAKLLSDWADIHFKIDVILKPTVPARLLLAD